MRIDIIPDDVKIKIYNSFCENVMLYTYTNQNKVNYINNIIKRFTIDEIILPKSLTILIAEIQKQYDYYLRINKLERLIKE